MRYLGKDVDGADRGSADMKSERICVVLEIINMQLMR